MDQKVMPKKTVMISQQNEDWIQTTPIIFAVLTVLVLALIPLVKRLYIRYSLIKSIPDRRKSAEEEIIRTPDELFAEKLMNDEYPEALEIASLYSLDTDPVYQKQWLKNPVTSETIGLYLAQVKNIKWSLTECLERLPETIESTRCLLEYGLSLTTLEKVIQVRFADVDISKNDNSVNGTSGDDSEGISHVALDDFEELTFDQKQMVATRVRLLQYLDRLRTYESILGGPEVAAYHFKSNNYEKFRNEVILETAISYAHSSDFKSVSVLFTYHGMETLDNWLPILSQFPEVISPFVYRSLLPECGLSDSDEDVYPWDEIKIRSDEDWSEKLLNDTKSDADEYQMIFYDLNPSLGKFRGRNLTKSILSQWFIERAKEIICLTSLVDNSLQLVKLGIERNLSNLKKLHDDLETYATIIYDCLPRAPDDYNDSSKRLSSFESFLRLDQKDIIRYLMAGTEKDGRIFVKSIRQFLLPYLMKYDPEYQSKKWTPLLEDYLVSVGIQNLSICRAVFENCVSDKICDNSYDGSPDDESIETSGQELIISNVEDLLRVALKIIYGCQEENFLDEAFKIVECLPQRTQSSSPAVNSLQDEVDDLEKHLAVAETLEKYGITSYPLKRLKELQSCQNQSDVERFFTEIIRRGSKHHKFKTFSDNDWKQLLSDVTLIHKDCFSHALSINDVNHIFIRILLTYGREENFNLAFGFMRSFGSIESCTDLIIDSVKDYINSANSLSDPMLGLAERCLKLLSAKIIQNHPDARDEQDFLNGLKMIEEHFDLSLLPVQIRLMDNPRLELIKKLLQKNPNSYKKSSIILKISSLLRICSDEDNISRDNRVLLMLGDAALNDQDYNTCYTMCQKIMSNNCSIGWTLCLKLGRQDNYDEPRHKLDLLSFALSHCEDSTGDRMNGILEDINRLRSEVSLSSMVRQKWQLETDNIHYQNIQKGLKKGIEEVLKPLEDVNLGSTAQLIQGSAAETALALSNTVTETASSLTSWLLPKLKNIKSDLLQNPFYEQQQSSSSSSPDVRIPKAIYRKDDPNLISKKD